MAQQLTAASIFHTNLRPGIPALVSLAIVATVLTIMPTAQAQTLTVLHTFTRGGDGGFLAPSMSGGVTRDAGGNLYGTTNFGGNITGQCGELGCGVVFKVSPHGVETPIYKFQGQPDGLNPDARVIFGPDGALYGTTQQGGSGFCSPYGCGTVFKLQPPPTFCAAFECPWRETIIYNFSSPADGLFPIGDVTFDSAGNLYGTTEQGGAASCSCGTVFKLVRNSNGTWTKTTLYSFQGGDNDGMEPMSPLVIDQAGNLYGTTPYGVGTGCIYGFGCGAVFELTPSGSGWTETILHVFTGGSDGGYPFAGLIFDASGNLYGAASYGPGDFGYGTLFELMPQQGGGWNFSVPYTFNGQAESPGPLTIDAAGNLYGNAGGGEGGSGVVYRLTNSAGAWTFTTLYSFGFDNSQGFFPEGKVVLGTQGNIYGVNSEGPYPSPDAGTVWELTP